MGARVSGGWYRSRRTDGGGAGCRARSSHSATSQPSAPDRWGCGPARRTATSLRGAVGYRSGWPGQSYPKRPVSRAPCHGQLSQGGRAELADLSWGQPGSVGGLLVGNRPEQHHAQQQPLARGQPIGGHPRWARPGPGQVRPGRPRGDVPGPGRPGLIDRGVLGGVRRGHRVCPTMPQLLRRPGIGRAWLVLVAHCSAVSRWAATDASPATPTDRPRSRPLWSNSGSSG